MKKGDVVKIKESLAPVAARRWRVGYHSKLLTTPLLVTKIVTEMAIGKRVQKIAPVVECISGVSPWHHIFPQEDLEVINESW